MKALFAIVNIFIIELREWIVQSSFLVLVCQSVDSAVFDARALDVQSDPMYLGRR